MRTPQLLMFDLDGTLVDTAPDLAYSIDQTLLQLGLPECGEQKVRNWIGSGIEGVMKRALANDKDGIVDQDLFDSALSIFREIYFVNVCKYSKVYPGVTDTLNLLVEKGIKLACVTNKAEKFTFALLRQIGLYDYFDIIVAGDTLEKRKPAAEPLYHAAKSCSVTITDCIMVGDSITDLRAARAAGCPVICVPYGYNMGKDIRQEKPDAVVQGLEEIPELTGL